MLNYYIIIKVLSRNLFILTFAFLSCIGIAIYFSESALPFSYSAIISASFAIFFYFITRHKNEHDTIKKREAYLTVTLAWLFISLFGCLPYLFSKSIPGFVDALFESVSGFTTTGSSILTNIEILPKSILFWRSLTHWIGGIGIIVLVIIIMPTLQMGSYQLFTLESSLQDKIHPKIMSVGKRLLYIYIALTISEVFLLSAFGMNLFDSFCHAFGTVATGGFSPKNTSITDYSPAIQYIIMIFMLLAGTNFVIHYFILKGRFKQIKENEELKVYLGFVIILGLIVTTSLFIYMNKPLEEAFREAFFQVISIITCTGFATSDYLQWPTYAWLILFFAMFLGGSTGSTAGGIKIARHLILFKNIRRTIIRSLSRNAVIPIKLNKRAITEKTNNSILTFISVYLMIFMVGSIIMVLLGSNGSTAFSSVATCMAGIGPGIGRVGPTSNFAYLPDAAKYLLTFLMLVGRLEIYTLIALFSPAFWAK
jgi:trk system potassium uptake protein